VLHATIVTLSKRTSPERLESHLLAPTVTATCPARTVFFLAQVAREGVA